MIQVFLFACGTSTKETWIPAAFNSDLAAELAEMVEIDQIAAYLPQGKYADFTSDQWRTFKDSVFTANKLRAEEILETHGYPGFDLVGEEGARDFWLLTQHADSFPEFQLRVLEAMQIQLARDNASKRNYAYLVDRVKKNSGEKLVYGTQVTYNEIGQAIPLPLEDSAAVNEKRRALELEPLEVYLNRMSRSHFEMNKEYYLGQGISEPTLYPTEVVP